MKPTSRLPLVLFFLRISIFLVMFTWANEKFILMGHADFFYLKHLMYIFGIVLLICFLMDSEREFPMV